MTSPARVTSGRALEAVFEIAKRQGRAALMPFLSAGDPNIETTKDILSALVAGGADIIELGIPFSDPVADGPTIQAASERALAAGTKLEDVLEVTREIVDRHAVPIILFGYYNPILAKGEIEFADRLSQSSAAGSLVVDLSFEESTPFRESLEKRGMHLISLIAPTTPLDRAARIADSSSGFLYYVSMTGVTGSAISDFADIKGRVTALKTRTDLPVAVGFGVREGRDVREIAKFADGVVVGSELTRRIHDAGASGAAAAAQKFISELRSCTTR